MIREMMQNARLESRALQKYHFRKIWIVYYSHIEEIEKAYGKVKITGTRNQLVQFFLKIFSIIAIIYHSQR